MKEINYKEMRFNPFRSALPLRSSKNLIGDEWMLESGFLYQDTIDATNMCSHLQRKLFEELAGLLGIGELRVIVSA